MNQLTLGAVLFAGSLLIVLHAFAAEWLAARRRRKKPAQF